jgi:hypothetical protein
MAEPLRRCDVVEGRRDHDGRDVVADGGAYITTSARSSPNSVSPHAANSTASYTTALAAVAGFSDGASYAVSLGLTNGDIFDAVLAFSPGVAAPTRDADEPAFFAAHGPFERCCPSTGAAAVWCRHCAAPVTGWTSTSSTAATRSRRW